MFSILIAATVGAGLVTGLLFAFSNFVMRALADLPREHGMLAMQRINVRIINPIFVFLFLGTPLLCVLIVIHTLRSLELSENWPALLGSLCYLLGPFGVTMLFNVPLNNRLAEADVAEADVIWTDYQLRWQRWNHLRTCIGVVAIALLASGIARGM